MSVEARARVRVEPPLVQILVVVANTRLGSAFNRERTDAEKGSSSTAIVRGLVDPKPGGNA